MDDFAFVADMAVRFRDLDPWDHVNNAVYGTYLEQARIEYMDEVLAETVGSRTFVLVHQELTYDAPITYGQDLTVAVRASEMGTSSLTFIYEVRADGDAVATAETTQVYMDGEEPAPLPAAWRDAIRDFEPGLA